jgi:hypothetical protein
MRLTITIDAISFTIDSINPELLGRWVVEIFERQGPFTPATYCTVQAFPSFSPAAPDTGLPRFDWIQDSRVLSRTNAISSPQGLLNALADQLLELDAL